MKSEDASEATQLNNQAIDLLLRSAVDQKDVEEATVLFTRALKVLKRMLLLNSQNGANAFHPKCSGFCTTTLVDGPFSVRPLPWVNASPSQYPTNYVFDRMFRLELLLVDQTEILMPSVAQSLIACVIFNTALLHHYKALLERPGRTRTSLLEKAVKLYDASCKILPQLRRIPPTENCMNDNLLVSLQVGILNNSAQIHYECCRYEHAHTRLKTLKEVLCTSHGLVNTHHCCLTDKELEGILANCLLLKPPSVAVAA